MDAQKDSSSLDANYAIKPLNGHRARPRSARFGMFELHPETRELFRQGVRIRLQIKPFQLLETLLQHPGELVTRDHLRDKLWPSGTFVDFESGLNTAMNRLRTALGDSADAPLYIETLPRMGYRFICPLDNGHAPPVPAAPPASVVTTLGRISGFRAQRTLRNPQLLFSALAVLLLFAALAVAFFRLPGSRRVAANFRPVSLRGGVLLSARFLAGSKVVYSARVNDVRQSFVANLDGAESRLLAVAGIVAAASSRGDLALLSSNPTPRGNRLRLVRSSLQGGATPTLADNAAVADWSPDGSELALVRETGAESQLEFPAGRVIFRSQGWIDCLRVSRSGREVAFLEHQVRDDDAGRVRIVDYSGSTRLLGPAWSSAEGLAWSPSGREIWFTASQSGVTRSLFSVSRAGVVRKLSNQPLSLRLLDVSVDGRALLAVDDMRMIMRTAALGSDADVSQFDYSHIDDMTHDGNVLLFTESGDAEGRHYAAYVYDRNARRATRFGAGRALSLSADGKQAITIDPEDRSALTINSIAGGPSVRLPDRGFHYQWARFFHPNQLLIGGSYPGRPLIVASQDIASGQILPLVGTPYLDDVALSPDGNSLAGRADGAAQIVDLRTKALRRLSSDHGSMPIAWSADSKSLFLLNLHQAVYSILHFCLATGQSTPWKTIPAQDAATFVGLAGIAAAPDSGAYAYSTNLKLSRLYLVDGLAL